MSDHTGKHNYHGQINTKLPHDLTKKLDANIKCRSKPIYEKFYPGGQEQIDDEKD
jgi:hypothetical protein